MVNSINILQQFNVVLESCDENLESTSIDSIISLLNNVSCDSLNKNINIPAGDIATKLNGVIEAAQNVLNSIRDKKTYHAMKLSNVNFIVREKYEAAVLMCCKLTEYINSFYKNEWINESNTVHKHNFEHQPFVSNSNEPPLEEINTLVNQVLKSVEKLYKKHNDVKVENDDEKLLKSSIVLPLTSDLENCDLISINMQLKNVLQLSNGDNVLKSCRPLLEQYALLVQYFITQQTMVYRVLAKMNYLLSTLFTDLTTNVS